MCVCARARVCMCMYVCLRLCACVCGCLYDDIFDRHSVCHHSFADDTQMQNSSSLDQLDTAISAMQECVFDAKSWMTLNRLQLNDGKTEAMLVMSERTSTAGLILQSVMLIFLTLSKILV